MQSLRAKNANSFFPNHHAVVVGGTAGIGCGIAKRLAQAQFDVTIVGRNAARGSEIVQELQSIHRSGTFSFVQCDAMKLKNVKTVSEQFKKVDRLVLTQGMATMQGRTETDEGIDQKLALHYFSRMAFIKELLPVLKQSESPRVLSVLSAGVHSAYSKYQEDFELKHNYSLKNAANSAGFYTDLMMDSYARDNQSVLFVHAAPGFVNTNWGTEMPWIVRQLLKPMKLFAKSPADCAEVMCDLMLRPNNDVVSKMGQVALVNANGGDAKANSHANAEAREFVKEHTLGVYARVLGQ